MAIRIRLRIPIRIHIRHQKKNRSIRNRIN